MKNRRQIIIKTLWERRWRETVLRCLMCWWMTATSRAGSTQAISRCDASAIPAISMNIWAWASSDGSSSLSATFTFPSVVTPCQDSDGRTCIVMSVTMWRRPKLSCANSLEWIFTLWVALLGSRLTGIHRITDFFKCGIMWKIHGNLLGLAGHLKKYGKVSLPARKHL